MTKKILLLHPNFPAQFRVIATRLGSSSQYDVRYVCFTHYGNKIKGVKHLVIKGEWGEKNMNSVCQTESEKTNFRSESYRRAFVQMRDSDWNPDIVISHSGWGCGHYVKAIWPKSLMITYVEWWFQGKLPIYRQQNEQHDDESTDKSSWERNIPIGFEISTADQLITPSLCRGINFLKT